jgi:serine phosphatase RsbU (regulator of sigma subunit)
MFGESRIKSLFKKISHLAANDIIRRLTDTTTAWMEGRELHDDMTLVVIKIKGK